MVARQAVLTVVCSMAFWLSMSQAYAANIRGRSCDAETIVRWLQHSGRTHTTYASEPIDNILKQALQGEEVFLRTHDTDLQSSGIHGKLHPLGSITLPTGVTLSVDIVFMTNQEFLPVHISKDAGSHFLTQIYNGFFLVISHSDVHILAEVVKTLGGHFSADLLSYFGVERVAGQSYPREKSQPSIDHPNAIMLTPSDFVALVQTHYPRSSLSLLPSGETSQPARTIPVNPRPLRSNLHVTQRHLTSRFDLTEGSDFQARTLGGTTYFFKGDSVIGYCNQKGCWTYSYSCKPYDSSHAGILRTQGVYVPQAERPEDTLRRGRRELENSFKLFWERINYYSHNRQTFSLYLLNLMLRNIIELPSIYHSPEVVVNLRQKMFGFLNILRNWLNDTRSQEYWMGEILPKVPTRTSLQIPRQLFIDPTADQLPIEKGKLYRFILVDTDTPYRTWGTTGHLILTRQNILHDQMVYFLFGNLTAGSHKDSPLPSFIKGGAFVLVDGGSQDAPIRVRLVQSHISLLETSEGNALLTLTMEPADLERLTKLIAKYLNVPPEQITLIIPK